MSDTFGLYKATINLNSRNLNQVPKSDLTAPEIAILRKVHSVGEGAGTFDPVVNIERIGEVKRSEAAERARLGGADVDGLVPAYSRKMFSLAFPHEHIPLPREIPGFEEHALNPASLANLKPKAKKVESVAELMD